jgi:hypothetical protein
MAGDFAGLDDLGRAPNCFSSPVGDATKGAGEVAQSYNRMLWILDLVKAATYPPS